MTPGAYLFFLLFAAAQVVMYLAIRREWFSPSGTAGVGVVMSIIFAALMAIARGNALGHALMVSIFMGGIFSGVTLAAAWYFHTSEMRSQGAAENQNA